DPSFYLVLICLLMWITGAWLSWCVLRWRKPMLGLIPGAAAFATNVLNVPQDQNGYTLAMLVLTLALLLWTNYTASIANAQRANVKLTGDARCRLHVHDRRLQRAEVLPRCERLHHLRW